MTTTERISRSLLQYREESGKSQLEIATEIGVALSGYCSYERNEGNPTAKTIDKIEAVLREEAPEILKKRGNLYEK